MMAKNAPTGDGHRHGAVRKRSQFRGPNDLFIKQDTETSHFVDAKSGPSKGVRRER